MGSFLSSLFAPCAAGLGSIGNGTISNLKQQEWVQQEAVLRQQMEQMVLSFPGYGYRRVTRALKRVGTSVNHKRVRHI